MKTITATLITPTPPLDSGHHFDNKRHWAASLTLGFDTRVEGDASITRMKTARHYGPLRVQRPFYPEGRDGCCHVYVLHPPGGLVSGDELTIEVTVDKGAHALVTTPAANKLYKADSKDVKWQQMTRLRVADGATLEWIPQESLAFDGSRGEQVFKIELGDTAKCLGWEVLCLGRPASHLPFERGYLEQRFELHFGCLEKQSQGRHAVTIHTCVIGDQSDPFITKNFKTALGEIVYSGENNRGRCRRDVERP